MKSVRDLHVNKNSSYSLHSFILSAAAVSM